MATQQATVRSVPATLLASVPSWNAYASRCQGPPAVTKAARAASDWDGLAREVSTMAHTDIYLDTILRHLGAAYYESLHGRATRSDVTRALDTVEEHLNEPASPAAARSAARHAGSGWRRSPGAAGGRASPGTPA
jgi:hypothetical protein